MQLPLASYAIESQASSQRLINCYIEQQAEGSASPVLLRRAPGIASFATLGGVGGGLHVMSGVLYAVADGRLYSIDQAGSETALGIAAQAEFMRMASSATQLYLNSGYIYESTLTAITDPDYIPGGACSFLDNYLLMIRPGTGQFCCSDLADFTSYDALNFATAEGSPDTLIGLEVDHRQAVLFGTESTEAWDNVGGGDFPFERSPNGFIEIGCAGARATTKQDQSVHWLANDRTLRRLSGNTATRTSQHGFERAVRDYGDVSDCQMYAYNLDGHLCVVIRFPEVGTWVYDCTTQQMHERQTYGRDDWDVSGFAECYGKVFVQRASDGAVGILTKDAYDDFGASQVVSWTYQNIQSAGRTTIDRLDIGIETGVGLSSGQGSDPRLSLEISYDGGKTYRSMPTRSIGAQGRYDAPVHWDRLGSGRNIVFRVSCSDPVPLALWSTDVLVR